MPFPPPAAPDPRLEASPSVSEEPASAEPQPAMEAAAPPTSFAPKPPTPAHQPPKRRPKALLLVGLAAVVGVGAFALYGMNPSAPPATKPAPKPPRVVAADLAKVERTLSRRSAPKAKPTAAKKPLSPAQLQAAIQRKYDDMSRFVMKRDRAGLDAFFRALTTTDFVFLDKRKARTDRETLLAQLDRQVQTAKRFIRTSNKVTAWRPNGATATAIVVSDFAMVFPSADGKGATLSGQSTTLDTWVKGRTGWKLRSVVTRREAAKLDGKPM